MQTSGEKLTIAEFAARAGCSPQRVSQLLQKSLKPFQIIESGRKYVLSDALPIVLEAREKQGYRKSFETVSETVSNSCETVSGPEEVERLTAELAEVQQRAADQLEQLDQMRAELVEAQQRAADADRKAQAAASEIDQHAAELARTRADLEAVREQRQKIEVKAAAAEAAADAERKRADAAEAARADLQKLLEANTAAAAEAAALAAERERTATERLAAEQQHAAELTAQLATAHALQAGQIQLAMKQSDSPQPVTSDGADDQQPKRRGLLARLFRRG